MLNYKTILLILILITIAGTIGYNLGKLKNVSPLVKIQPKADSFNCPYIVKNSIYGKYDIATNDVAIKGTPIFIDKPKIIKLETPFNKQEFVDSLPLFDNNKDYKTSEFDVDEDGKKETIISANIAMNHTPHIAIILKNGSIIFDGRGPQIWINEVTGGNGFILHKTINWETREEIITRYIPKDGGFMPIWEQKSCSVKFE